MHGRTHGVSRDRPDFVRRGERCWIDGDLIRLAAWPIGGIRPGGRAGPIPWLMDLSVLEEAMQSVYGSAFRLGDRAPLLQMAVNALAVGDGGRAAEIANEVSFPPPEYASRFRDACVQHLNWGPAHRRGNPPIDVQDWLARKSWERKYDPDQPRVPAGHRDGGQWTDGFVATVDGENPGEELLTSDEQEEVSRLTEQARRILAEAGDPGALLILAAGGDKPPKLPRTKSAALVFFAEFIKKLTTFLSFEERNSPVWHDIVFWVHAIDTFLPEFETFLNPPKEWEDLVADQVYREFDSQEAFEEAYGSAGLFHDWHHLVERNAGFSPEEVHNTKNIVRIPRGKHWLITSYMTTKRKDLGWLSYREWLRGRPIEEHLRIGLKAARETGVLK
jgi:hypothetical protein